MAGPFPDFPISHENEYNCVDAQPTRSGKNAPPKVIVPSDPPDLNPAAARVLLRTLLAAHQRLPHPESEEA